MAFSCLLVFVHELYHGRKSVYDFVGTGFLFTLSAVTHPLNALFGGLFFVVFGIALFFVLRHRWFYSFIIINATFCILVLLPWVYSVKLFSKMLPVADAAINAKNFRYIGFPYDTLTNLLSRLSPFPIEFRTMIDGSKIATPHQDAQILLPLLIIVGLLYWFRCKDYASLERLAAAEASPVAPFKAFLQPLFYAAFFLFAVSFVICIYPPASAIFGGIFDILQFCYRLINYVNLSLVALAWLLLAFLRADNRQDALLNGLLPYFMVACITISVCGLYEKLVHAESLLYVRQFNADEFPDEPNLYSPIEYQRNPAELPRTSYGHFAYIIKKHIQPLPDSVDSSKAVVANIPLDPKHFGKPAPLALSLPAPAFVKTNVEPFLWNYILVDGKTVEWKDLYLTPFDGPDDEFGFVYGLQLPAGNHVLEYQFKPHVLWSLCQTISWQVTLLWLLCYCVVLFMQLRQFLITNRALSATSATSAT
ncbi:MAG: hypothetical protein ACAI35_04760 [Candidatus Methylacidiphilales bacterium]|nr:hypothetical protein [Candidatus Methylacidiphilales bacterium]